MLNKTRLNENFVFDPVSTEVFTTNSHPALYGKIKKIYFASINAISSSNSLPQCNLDSEMNRFAALLVRMNNLN